MAQDEKTLTQAQAELQAAREREEAERARLRELVAERTAYYENLRAQKQAQEAAAREERKRNMQAANRAEQRTRFERAYIAAGGLAANVDDAFERYIEQTAIAAANRQPGPTVTL